MLKEEGYLISEEGRNTNRLWDGDSHERVLQIRRAVLDEFSVNKIPTWKEHV